MSKHTPGPWTQHEGEVWAKNYGLISRSYYGKPDGEGAANARLIAAAPELLEFAEEVRRTGDTRLASMAIAVIAKAIGEAK